MIAVSEAPNIISLCETWLDETISDEELYIDGYTLTRRDRNRNGGGVAIYTQDTIPFSTVLKHHSIELLVLSLKLKSRNVSCAVLYRQPSADPAVLDELESSLLKLTPSKLRSMILVGDFNHDVSPTAVSGSPPPDPVPK